MNKQQTAVEWLISQYNQYRRPSHMPQSQFKQVCEQALAMEKQQQKAALTFAHTMVTKEAPLHYLFNEYNKMIEPTNEENLEYFHKLTEFIKQKTEQLREINSDPTVSDDFQIGPNGAYEHIDPQDKAQKLVAHYEAICKDFTRELRLPHSFAKVCALITVDAQIELYNELMFLGLLEPNAIGIELVQVKQEIQKL